MREKFKLIVFNRIKKGDFRFAWEILKNYLLLNFSILKLTAYSSPLLGMIIPTYKCNLRCKMCNFWREKNNEELSKEEIFRVIDEFADMSTNAITFSGGEPLLREDVFEIMKYAKDKNMVVHLATNGTLIDKRIAKKLYNLEIDAISISLDASNAKIHDNIRGVKGSFERTIESLRNLSYMVKNNESSIDVVSLLSRYNIKEIPKIFKLIRKIGINSLGVIPLHNFSYYSKEKSEFSSKEIDEIDKTIDEIISLKKECDIIDNSFEYLLYLKNYFRDIPSEIPCSAGLTTCVIGPKGDIFPCYGYYEMRKRIGNIKEKNLKEFWYSKEYNDIRKILFNCRKCVWNCHFEFDLVFKNTLLIRQKLMKKK